MPDKIVNHFVLADGSIAKYDATQLAGDILEVVDIRTGYDGTVYESAGDAVRGQTETVNNELIAQLGLSNSNFFNSLNKFNAYINGSKTIVANNSNRLAWVKLMPNCKYNLVVSKKANTDMQIMVCDTLPAAGVVGINKYDIPASATSVNYDFSTDATHVYLAFKYWATSATTYTEDEVLGSIRVTLLDNIFDNVGVVNGALPNTNWIFGGVIAETGKITYASNTTYVFPSFIDKRVKSVTPKDGYYIAIFAYDKGDYVGCYIGSQTSSDGTFAKSYNIKKVQISFDDLRETYPTYQFRLVLGTLSGQPSDILENIIFEYYTTVTDNSLLLKGTSNTLYQAKKARGDNGNPLTLLHFSDIHGNADRLGNIIGYINEYSPFVNDAICTGDLVGGQNSDGIDFWTSTAGASDILTCIGNHDAVTAQIGGSVIDMQTLCAMFISPFIANWGTVVHPTDATYYYKDYADSNVRLIVLDCMHDDANQLSWLQSALTDAKTNDLHVVIGIHYPAYPRNIVNCAFSPALDKNVTMASISADILSAVDSFQNDGGKFVCYLTGHEHQDYVMTPNDYPNQLVLSITCATNVNAQAYNSDQYRFGDASNAVNLVTINTVENTVSIKRLGADMDMCLRDRKTFCYNYGTHALLN